ncbi:hypothetical protein GQR58_026807 [Nymphon striatum]|nr:hypothetical protein GQR58_026807 [Nymphon striatum]
MRRHPDTGAYGRLLVSDFVDLKTLAQRNAKINSGISISSTKKIQTQHYQYGLEKYNYQPLKNSGAFYAEQEHVNAGDRIAYYSQLAEWGYKYAELALEVVNADTLSGRTANHYFLDQASDEGATITNNDLAQISLQLMQEDFAARVAFTGSASGQELPVNTIKDYHETVFNNFGVSDNGWTPNFALESLDTVAEQEAFWDELLNATNPFEATGLLVSPTEGDSSLEAYHLARRSSCSRHIGCIQRLKFVRSVFSSIT